jgi:DNA-directed RNA polymerase specialized sigma24 family protein
VTHDRAALRHGGVSQAKTHGWTDRRTRAHDARIVRVLDFERALACIAPQAQALLLLTYRDGFDHRRPADTAGLSVRALAYKLPLARQALAAALDSLDLL